MSAVMAVVFLIMAWAKRGNTFAIGISTALLMLVLVGLVYAGTFALVWLVGQFSQAVSSRFGRAADKEKS